jgi:hypothetical protein
VSGERILISSVLKGRRITPPFNNQSCRRKTSGINSLFPIFDYFHKLSRVCHPRIYGPIPVILESKAEGGALNAAKIGALDVEPGEGKIGPLIGRCRLLQ